MSKPIKIGLMILVAGLIGLAFTFQQKPTIYIIGDSTTKNTLPLMGWGTAISDFFDTTKINIANHAMAGRSTRTFVKEGRWDKVDSLLKPGDYVLMVFGHNEGAKPGITPPNADAAGRAIGRGVLKGIGEDTVHLIYPNGSVEIVHTFGWYIRKFIREAKTKGATPMVLSMIPHNLFRDGKVPRADKDYGLWSKQVAEQEGVIFIDMNNITADKYEKLGADSVNKFFAPDKTHTTKLGATVNAQSVVVGIRANPDNPLNKYLLNK
ncbi:rhamnogalacturonan acetylesterase [Mucilaginibacter boryungensis]|uniref:Rhamnogalacturonan acetylesterase n=1 Tax=Mucilaginibacter boryungensis TaxID=768480 RepID=A0ABR9XGQ8_9SPHI|nr:rhamnogalacturonan acetylesterase [Mucilaginibacter boryungensis]MBE9666395.1 rhamnogalacturonan acetylesterase [Mucilaginibacter boryungensis]